MSGNGKQRESDEAPQSSSRGPSQFLVDQDPHQEGDGPARWEKLGDQPNNNPELSDFLLRVSSITGLDSTRYIGGKNRKGS
ncbi:hypothetical protein IFM58399_02524 [Aspergillus lentulus]|uniref:Uncharacterized protein n=1 Tax=Aspergillus lentulus TaxID=293939 RepID=A0ABQ0ZT37_ASPLE|nr:uncharacterized protein IFM58399_02524 [Aspergillus lentulus]GFF30257.1 hypothetical protein IFM58399_02524 [Aspergillus lentulus]GFF63613.1 hypothetical protein IFM60648_00982 [Aspergillus lentulus]GFF65219.1 hypothetical protein IFM62136_06226 [Aspergillus lentulus]GFF67354.1 hypothetical protein IFM47457_01689 [Aspergillus lentulus]GFF99374.1 hypothetical protein IFM61392_00802 [Aspergillus lentulus]